MAIEEKLNTIAQNEPLSVTEKLVMIAENEQRVFDAGRRKGHTEQVDYNASLNAFLDAFWDTLQVNGNRTTYNHAFCFWDSFALYPKYNISGFADISYGFYKMGGEPFDLAKRFQDCGIVFDTSAATNPNGIFRESVVTRVPELNLTNASEIQQTFYLCEKLVTVDKLVLSTTQRQYFSNTFTNCYALENLIIEGVIGNNGFNVQWSTKLSHDSIVSIINALSTTTTNRLTVTLSKTAVAKAFETSEGANDGTTSEEWLNLSATKSKWIISLK